MKKRTIVLLIALLFINISILTSCGKHEHTFDEGRVIQESTCTKEGIKEFKCTECEETKQETINKLEHLYETIIIRSTCKETGLEIKVCKLCNDKQEKVLEKLDHTIVIDEAVEATCKETGLTEGTHCSECGEVIKKQEVILVLEHNYVDGKCSNCDAKDPNYKEEHTHTESDWIILEEATCTKEGKKQKKCTSCDEVLSEETIKKLDHTIVIDKAVEATCRNTGLTEGSHCSECGEVIKKQKTVEKLEHNYVDGKCSNCDSKDPNYKDENASEGLSFELNEDKKSYSVTGIGTCTDTDIIIPSVYNGLPVTSIGDRVFYQNYNITSITIPNSIIEIGNYAFYECYKVTNVFIPSSVICIGYAAFSDCDNTVIYCEAESIPSEWNKGWTNDIVYWGINENNFVEKNNIQYILNIENSTATLVRYTGVIKDVVIPNYVELNNKKYSVTEIGVRAFYCYDIFSPSSIIISDSVTIIETWAFSSCSSLESIFIPDSVVSIESEAVTRCNIVNIYCASQSQPSRWNSDWNYDKRPVYWGIKEIYLYEDNEISYILNLDTKEAIVKGYTGNDANVEIEPFIIVNGVEYSVTNIGDYAFYDCESLTSIEIPNSVTSIGDYAFYDCDKLTSITIPNSVTNIGDRAFSHCANLTSIIIPNSVTSIGNMAFYVYEYNVILKIYCEATSQPTGWNSDWKGSRITVYWGINETNLYEANGIQYVFNLETKEAIVAVYIGNDSSIEIESLIVVNGVEYIVTSIGDRAFSACDSLETLVIPNSVTSIGSHAFEYCDILSVVIPGSVTTIESSAFYTCLSLTIYCEVDEEPDSWDYGWNTHNRPVVWGYTKNE